MSDQSDTPSLQSNMTEISDTVEQAVSGNEQSSDEIPQEAESAGTEGLVEQAEEAKATLKDPKASKAQKQEAKKQLRKIKLKVDGEEFEEEYDPEDEDYIREQLQLAKVSRKRMQEKSAIEKEVLKFIEDLKKNPRKALSDPAIGIDIKELAQKVIEEEIENSKKSPEQLALEKAQEELRQLKEQKEKEDADRKTKEFERLREQEFERYEMLMSKAFEKHNIPNNPAVVKRMADYMLISLEAKKDIAPEDIVPLIREDLKNDYRDILNSMPDDDAIEEFIGKEFVDRIRRSKVAKAKKVASNPAVKAATKTPSTGKIQEPKETDKKVDYKKFFGI